MKYYYVHWQNYQNKYRSTIVTCESKEQAERIVKQAYKKAKAIQVRQLKG